MDISLLVRLRPFFSKVILTFISIDLSLIHAKVVFFLNTKLKSSDSEDRDLAHWNLNANLQNIEKEQNEFDSESNV